MTTREVRTDVKASLAEAIQGSMLGSLGPEATVALTDVAESVEVTAVTPLQTQIRVRMRRGGPRYFLVRFSEVH